MTRRLLVPVLALAILLLGACAGPDNAGVETAPAVPAPPAAKIPVASLDELPVHTYPLQGTLEEMMADPAVMAALRGAVRADLEADMATYAIEDVATLQGMHQGLVTIALADGDDAAALRHLDAVRELEDKEAARLMNGLVARADMAARAGLPADATADQVAAAYEAELRERVFALPYDVVEDDIKSGKARAEYLSENLLRGIVQSRLQPTATAMGELNRDLALGLIGMRYAIDERLALNPVTAAVYGDYLARNKQEKTDIWPARDLALTPDQGLAPVVIGIWDSGVDVASFDGLLWTNAAERADGADTDGNGFVDDVHGIAFDLDGVANPHLLHPLGDQEGKLGMVYESMEGFIDMTSAIDSPAATAVRSRMASMAPEEVGDFMTSLSFGGLYMHGTHVAGIASRGNPFARLLVARITFDYHSTPAPMTMEIARRLADDYLATAKYFQAADVRVVNMSWGWSYKEIEGGLEANGIGADAEERAKLARQMIGVLSDGLHDAIAAAPGILFVAAAGNDDNDVEFDVVIPSSFDLPNLMVVGALDQAGDPTGFTSGGRNVKVYANGFQVESTVPGGRTMKMSGTSMASPNVANTAAKLVALQPALTPPAIIDLIERGADAHPDHPEIFRMNAKKSAALLANGG
ncbi:S8 family serine peptidase [bacterium]|nr:S8 family serine peptidase [bacterium]